MQKRLIPIDVFRAVTMLLMIFVNDVSGVADLPAWLGHTQAQEDGMGFADTIFPAFLFIVGLSLPFAIGSRINKGHSFLSIAWHILLRSAALIIMGFYHVNSENYSSTSAIPQAVWMILITVAFFLVWLDYPSTLAKSRKVVLIATGIGILLLMAWLYKGGDGSEVMQPSWWGILGIIGWAYLVCALLYLIVKGNMIGMLILLGVLLAINITEHADVLHLKLPVVGDASSATLIMAGAVMGLLYGRFSTKQQYKNIWLLLTIAGICFIVFGFIVRPYAGGISKIYATPAWVLITAGISMLVFCMISLLADRLGKQHWFNMIRPAGTSTLTCYLLPYLLYSIFTLTHFHYPYFFNHGIGGVIRSFAVAFILVLLAGVLEKKRIRLKI